MDINIMIFGDSIVYGAWDYNKNGWVNRLRMLFEQKYTDYYNISYQYMDKVIGRLEERLSPEERKLLIRILKIMDEELMGEIPL